MNIYQRLIKVGQEVDYIKKDSTISMGGSSSYTAVSHDQVSEKIRRVLFKNGVMPIASLSSVNYDSFSYVDRYGNNKKMYTCEVLVNVKMVNSEDPTDLIEVSSSSFSMDSGDKSFGKAMSMAVKYAILKLFMIPTGDKEEERMESDVEALDPRSEEEKTPGPMYKFVHISGLRGRTVGQIEDIDSMAQWLEKNSVKGGSGNQFEKKILKDYIDNFEMWRDVYLEAKGE